MYEKTDKRRLYWLLDEFLSGKINESMLCDEFYYSYDLELNHESLTKAEKESFSELNQVISRFSEFEEDHKLDSKAFFTKEQLHQKAQETQEKLKSERL